MADRTGPWWFDGPAVSSPSVGLVSPRRPVRNSDSPVRRVGSSAYRLWRVEDFAGQLVWPAAPIVLGTHGDWIAVLDDVGGGIFAGG